MKGNRLTTPVFLIIGLWMGFPPVFLPCVPSTGSIRASRDDPSDRLTHSVGGLPRLFGKLEALGVNDVIPEVDSNLTVFLAEFHPLIECLSYK